MMPQTRDAGIALRPHIREQQVPRPCSDGCSGAACALQVANLLNEETAQLYALCGRGPRSSLRVLRHGLAVAEMAVSELPGNPTAVWTIRRSVADELDAYIIVSFTNATLARPTCSPVPESRKGIVFCPVERPER